MSPVTSARAGYRKPHSGIYQVILDQLRGVPRARRSSLVTRREPDVTGPLEFGIAAVHIDRVRLPTSSPELVTGSYRIDSLEELLSLPELNRRGDLPPVA